MLETSGMNDDYTVVTQDEGVPLCSLLTFIKRQGPRDST